MSVSVLVPADRSTPWRRWITVLGHREAGTTLALFRIACGLCLLYTVGSVAIHGLVPALWMGPDHGGYTFVSTPRLFQLIGGVNPTTVWSMIAIALTAGLLLTIGLAGRVAAFVALQSFMALVGLNSDAAGSYDGVLTNTLWLLVLSASTATLSVECKLRTGQWTSATPVPA